MFYLFNKQQFHYFTIIPACAQNNPQFHRSRGSLLPQGSWCENKRTVQFHQRAGFNPCKEMFFSSHHPFLLTSSPSVDRLPKPESKACSPQIHLYTSATYAAAFSCSSVLLVDLHRTTAVSTRGQSRAETSVQHWCSFLVFL